ncbi:MAG: hypothetical protein HRF44_11040 [Ignavibacterium sp.]
MRPWSFGLALGVAGVMISSLLIWWLASSDTSFSDRWLTVAILLPLGGVYLGWDRQKKVAAASPEEQQALPSRATYIVMAALLAGLTQYLTFIIASSIWNADMIDPSQSGFFHHLFNPNSLPGLSSRGSGGTTESDWIGMTLIGIVVGALMMFYITRTPKAQ